MTGFFKIRIRNRLLARAWQEGSGKPHIVNPVFPDVRKGLSWGFLYGLGNADDLENLKDLLEFLKKEGIDFRILAVETGKCFKDGAAKEEFEEQANVGNRLVLVARGSVNWAGVPQGGGISDFLRGNHNLLVVFNENYNFTIDYLALQTDASFVIGMCAPHKGYFNMVLAPTEKELAPAVYVQELKGYLRNMNVKEQK